MKGGDPVTEAAAGAAAAPGAATAPGPGAMTPAAPGSPDQAPVTPRNGGPGARIRAWTARRARALFHPTLFNPLIQLELRSRMRRGRTVVLLLAFTGALGSLLVLALHVTTSPGGGIYGPSPFEVSYWLFQAAIIAELVMVGAVAAATASGAISGERERQTWEVLLTTRLPAWRIVTGKLVTAVLLVFWLVVASLPLFLPLFRFGAVSPGTLARVLGLFLASGLVWAALGLFFSALFRRTTVAVIASYATASAWVILTAAARRLRDLWFAQRSAAGAPVPPQPEGPFLVELMNPLLALLKTLESPLEAAITSGGSVAPTSGLTWGARLAGALGQHGFYWVYVLGAAAVTAVLAFLTTRLVARRRV